MLEFSSHVLRYIVGRVIITEKFLNFIFLWLPEYSTSLPYNADFISLESILQVTTKRQIITHSISCGIQVTAEGILAAGVHIPNGRADVLEYILDHVGIKADKISIKMAINNACTEAIKRCRSLCVAAFIKHGATPDPDKLLEVPEILKEPSIYHYYQLSLRSRGDLLENMTNCDDNLCKVKK